MFATTYLINVLCFFQCVCRWQDKIKIVIPTISLPRVVIVVLWILFLHLERFFIRVVIVLVWIGHYCTGTWITFFFGKNRCLQHNNRPACSIFAEKWISKLKEEVRNCYQQHGQYVILRETQTYMNENGSVLQGVHKIVFSNLLAFCIFCIPATLAYVAVLLAVLNCFWNN